MQQQESAFQNIGSFLDKVRVDQTTKSAVALAESDSVRSDLAERVWDVAMQHLRKAEMTVATICHSQTERDALSETFKMFIDGPVKTLHKDLKTSHWQ